MIVQLLYKQTNSHNVKTDTKNALMVNKQGSLKIAFRFSWWHITVPMLQI